MLNLAITTARKRSVKFVYEMYISNGRFRLSANAEPSAYARCFGIFSLHLLGEHYFLSEHASLMAASIADDLKKYKTQRLSIVADLAFDKPYLQLLCFSLSALCVLNRLHQAPLEDHISPLIERDIVTDLQRGGCLIGRPASGNQAMFIGIINLYAQRWLNLVGEDRINYWVDAHLNSMNRFGLWGPDDTMTHLLFQNGFHQYEIFEYLGIENPYLNKAANAIAKLVDNQGHFGPYPGGGSCYDYDAVAILTSLPDKGQHFRNILDLTAKTLLSEQNKDGGFCDSKYIRPLGYQVLRLMSHHVLNSSSFAVMYERARLCFSLMLPKHNLINGHWSAHSRRWDESDLFGLWFRLLTLARIQVALDPNLDHDWSFIDFPGIGYVRSHVTQSAGLSIKD